MTHTAEEVRALARKLVKVCMPSENAERASSMLTAYAALLERHNSAVTDDRFLWGVVANAGRLSDWHKARWGHVSDATAVGSQSSIELCRRFGFDPDEEVGGGTEAADTDDDDESSVAAEPEQVEQSDGWQKLTDAVRDMQAKHLDNHQGDVYHAMQYIGTKYGKPALIQPITAAPPAQPADSGRVRDAREYLDNCVNALDHIARTARRCRVTSRRLTWIASRAESAINGNDAWRDVPVPKNGASALLRAQARVKELEAALAAQGQPAERVPDGCVLVPREPTDAMLTAGAAIPLYGQFYPGHTAEESERANEAYHATARRGQIYKAMLAAPPSLGDWDKVQRWRSIETPPTVASAASHPVLVYLPEFGVHTGWYTKAYADKGKFPWSADTFCGMTNQTITHWMPLPAAPQPGEPRS